ncbi:uncharacterized protein LOC129972470 [Argiope bruennichi]|uniref:uncharacterized protein LOC129972470 n=1 Tax=Argiope bruennichi TaxID=94029 RepID=UPI0024946E5C|nr:uncharacterized protein LOC129972470 [Argiope bruennichi]
MRGFVTFYLEGKGFLILCLLLSLITEIFSLRCYECFWSREKVDRDEYEKKYLARKSLKYPMVEEPILDSDTHPSTAEDLKKCKKRNCPDSHWCLTWSYISNAGLSPLDVSELEGGRLRGGVLSLFQTEVGCHFLPDLRQDTLVCCCFLRRLSKFVAAPTSIAKAFWSSFIDLLLSLSETFITAAFASMSFKDSLDFCELTMEPALSESVVSVSASIRIRRSQFTPV